MSVAVTSLCWVPRGKAARKAAPYMATDAELDAIDAEEKRLAATDTGDVDMEAELDSDSEGEGADATGGAGGAGTSSSSSSNAGADESESKTSKKKKSKKSSEEKKSTEKNAEGKELTIEEEFDLDNYDDDDELQNSNVFGYKQSDKDMALNDELLAPEQQDSDSDDEEDDEIKETDNVFVACSCEDEACTN